MKKKEKNFEEIICPCCGCVTFVEPKYYEQRCGICHNYFDYESGAVLMPFMLNCPQCGQKNGLELDRNEKIKVYSL